MLPRDRDRGARQPSTCRYGGRPFLVSPGITARGQPFVAAVLAAVTRFDRYDRRHPPHDQHASGTLMVAGARLTWRVEHPHRRPLGASIRRITVAPARRRFTLALMGEACA